MEKLPLKMKQLFNKAKLMIESSEDIKIYSHNDCDGISAGAILSTILDRQEKDHDIEIVSLDKLENLEIENELTIFSDLGSGQEVDKLANNDSKIIILDHHPPIRDLNYRDKASYNYLEINPLHHGIDGSYHVSGGGLSYLLAREFGYIDLSWIGVLAAIGDMQNSSSGKLEGLNSIILNDSVNQGYVQSINDLSLYGRQTRPLFVALSYFSDVNLPITNNRTESIALMKDLGIPRKVGDRSRTLSDLDISEKGKLFSELVKMLSKEVPKRYIHHVPKLVASDSYEFMMEENHTFLRDAAEFSTAMNACTRNNREDIALEILKGNRTDSLDQLEIISKEHRRYLAQNIHRIEEEDMIKNLDNIQYFDGNGIKSQVVGTIAGMILSYGDWRKPMIGFTQISDEDENLKVSLRCSRLLAYDGIHFGNIIRKVSKSVGGSGGGHSVACGAYIPIDKKEEFLSTFNNQLNGVL
ncbi:MAG: DHH family phosphoesterase [Methanobrevibacter arboriphilus]|jgi:RecJ-like exonuclease|uniref:Single-stranded DNA-binding protein n=2 Tax=Methanobrevibacter arboriphilus TaxID=39441 RepID=A0ACA8R792_METAZ|nr:single-stranded-DNA-specific exonuclease RecJ [Methanobrevibacter arboriphilus]MBF4469695.1 DHH family phosphoesterase [Methanobrevibacter arboriphilus]MCC7562839.1 DHH family phosphoesterase [Methanobrevibacter arboriphilus]BBL62955.1 single-stranded DNA-binding protein [Methanobrevibacter arboriphilus]GLI12160.1 single-stranded DNA-binding protein [Methanobrevibacter arboriphilus]